MRFLRTPLYDRLREAGRLNDAEAAELYGTSPLGHGARRVARRIHQGDVHLLWR
jgi:hypothetical protein